MRTLFLAYGLLNFALPASTVDTDNSIEVDFSPLSELVGRTDFTLDFDFHSHGDHSLYGVEHIQKKSVREIRDGLLQDLLDSNWLVKAEGETKLIVYGRKDDPIQKAKFKVDTFDFKPKGNVTPTVRRIQKV